MRIYYGIILIFLSAIVLVGCSDSAMVSDFEKARNYFNERMGSNSLEGVSTPTEKLKKWYSWKIDSNTENIQAPDGTQLLQASVTNIVDGDTVDVEMFYNDKKVLERVRAILINTPESKGKYEDNPEPFAIDAYEFTKDLLTDRTVWIEIGTKERDQYGRLLAYIWLDQVVYNKEVGVENNKMLTEGELLGMVTLNQLLLREGLAQVTVYPPNTKYVDEFESVEDQARKEDQGMWK